ncbi:MAG: hypothetical protein ABL955_06630, partial [Elusimicrobiota bacterium]
EGTATDRTPVAQAVASVRRLWKSATAVSLPGTGDSNGADSSPPLVFGALALGTLIAGALFMRRKG